MTWFLKRIQTFYPAIRGFASVKPLPRASYACLEDKDLTHFEAIVGSRDVQTDDLDPYNIDFLKAYKGSSKCVLFPTSYDEVSEILRHCYSRRLAVVPQSGNTGLVGGSVPVYDEVIVSLRKLNKRFTFDPHSGLLDCDAGFILEEVDNRLADDRYMVPWELASRGSCLLGGNISTNVGGVRRLRFGPVRSHILGLDVALADESGSVVTFGSNMKKDNTGLHTHHLFIGAEGQLGVIVGVKMCATARPMSTEVMMLGAENKENCLKLLHLAKQMLGEILSVFEIMDSHCMRCLLENNQLKSVLTTNPSFTLLIETMGSNEAHDKEKVEKFLNTAIDQGICSDGVQAANAHEADYMWKLRKTIPLAPILDGYVYKHDIALPMEHFFTLPDVVFLLSICFLDFCE
ncbi:unnamed protein product [Gongylonema pulchrum]|uniref:D-2-hydroxyglutarate dehydrogenase, mitochondrial n=1 Tax=Gongylonema pulchrum TaxID=637853 RepID=A0A183CZP5_9BILA|nr:unnamed protein product [Gongylonema pulchrum]